MDPKKLRKRLQKEFPKAVLDIRPFGRTELPTLWIEMASLRKVAEILKTDPEFELNWLESFTAIQVDQALVLNYWLRSYQNSQQLVVRGTVVPAQPELLVEVDSLRDLWPMISSKEEEVSVLFGVHFRLENKKETLPRCFNPEVEGYPLRKGLAATSANHPRGGNA